MAGESTYHRLDDGLLCAFMSTFYGYGNPRADLWFVGMEEGGGNELDEVRRRLCAWDERGRKPFEDVVDYHRAFGRFENFRSDRPKIQRTWRGLIHIGFATRGLAPDREAVRAFQRVSWARSQGNVCSVELLPLPSPGLDHWYYDEWSSVPVLSSRKTYEAAWLTRRIQGIRRVIAEADPKVVVFYGQGYQRHWSDIAGADLTPAGSQGFAARDIGNTRFASIRHPTAKSGVNDAYLAQVGRYVAERLC